ncbi:hypothetical protein LH464_04335 [Neorhizobium sp. T786]|uniref:hypothetical protein n=1 Tax=Pseudorhizobium xiangyangii TaxID=2883104 RepID=UPI001CFFC767|nr:hypothetical protein [Neorhizobium xiangyangii]MCB5201706.1 hypothetical protein [Neorhizobium xiangyangii]
MIYVGFTDHWSFKPTDEEQDFIRANWPEYRDDYNGKFSVPHTKARMSWDEVAAWTEAGFKLELEPCKSMMLVKRKDIHGHDEDSGHEQLMSGKLFNVTLPDVGLLLIDEVKWLDDACTEELQRNLDDGWRILAVCPPNAQRRPDYILGRRKRGDGL